MPSRLTSISFLLVIFGVPAGQALWELSNGGSVQALEVIGPIERTRLDDFEADLQEASWIDTYASPLYREALTKVFLHGNQKAVIGTDQWIYYGRDLDLITAPGFMDGPSPTALETIVDFRDQLASRGVELLLVPVPAKAAANPQHLSPWTSRLEQASNTDSTELFLALAEHQVHCLDFDELYTRLHTETDDLYLARDTHWTPRTMEAVAREVANRVRDLLGESPPSNGDPRTWTLEVQQVKGPGDMIDMLQLPEDWQPYEPMDLSIRRVLSAEDGTPFESDESASVLLLGDSFSGVFGDPQLGLGANAGLAAHLAYALDRPIDSIIIAGGSSLTVRERLARRPTGVAGKQVVVWQISQRDFVAGPQAWTRVELPEALEVPEPTLDSGELTVLVEITEVSEVSDDFDYAFCLGVVEYKVLETLSGATVEGPLWVAHVVMEDFEKTAGAAFQVGERYRLTLDKIEKHHDLDVTAWVDDTDSGREIWFATKAERVE